jgi:putative ABC transport system permease protein
VALINFVNLSLAQASLRQREVSLRRVLGASRGQLVAQFMLQAVLAAGLAGLLALALVELLMPAFRGFVDRPLPGWGAIGVAATAALVLLLGLAVGALPAWRLSGGRPVQALRANRSSGQVHSARWRSLLVTLQFALAIGLGAALVVAIAQFRHLQRQDRGLDVQGVLSIWGLRWPEVRAGAERFVAEARALPGVVAVGRSSDGPGKLWPSAATASVWAADGQEAAVVSVEPQSVDDEFFAAYRVNVLAGRVLSQQVAADRVDGIGSSTWPADRSINVVIDELASRRLGWAKPEQAIGRPIKVSLSRRDAPAVPATVVGVVRSVQARSAQEAAVPRIYYRNMQDIYFFSVRMAPPQMAQARGELQALWQRSFPRVEYDPVVVADAFEQDLARELRVGQLFGFAAAVALLLAAAGLYALSTFAIQRRAKEMALRRLMGASWQQVGRLLLWQLMRPVLVAAAIACPLAWWGLQDWLNDFEVRVPLSPVHLAGAVGAALAIAWATVASRVWSAAHRAPAQELHDE